MTHIEKRCCYCGHTYYFQGSGDGCFEKTNNDRYCPKCMKIIIDSLEKMVPKEDIVVKKTKEIGKETLSSKVLNRMEQLKNDHENEIKNRRFSTSTAVTFSLDFDNIEIYRIDRNTYYIWGTIYIFTLI